VRERSLELLERPPKAPALDLGWVVRFLANHERQHAETMAAARIAAGLHLAPSPETSGGGSPGVAEADQPNGIATALGEGVGLGQRSGWVEVPGGSFAVGADDPEGWDNERSQHVLTAEQFR